MIMQETIASHMSKDMETEEVSRMPALPMELVEKILAVVPFPYIFKARALSKSWLTRLSPVSSHNDDEEKTHMEIPFQRRMALHWSTKWPTFCPVLVGNDETIAYDRVSRLWQRLPSLSFLSENLDKLTLEIRGPFFFISHYACNPWERGLQYVVNVLTRSSKQLPPRPGNEVRIDHIGDKATVVSYNETYKVIEFYELQPLHNRYLSALIYDFKEDAWMSKIFEIPAGFGVYGNGVYFNGAIYWCVARFPAPMGLLAFNVEEESFQVLQFPALDLPLVIGHSWESSPIQLVVCDGSLWMLVMYAECSPVRYKHRVRVIVIKIDLESRSWLEVTRGPPDSNHRECVIASDGNRIFIMGQCRYGGDLTVFESGYEYNVKGDEWTMFPLPNNNVYGGKSYTCSSSSFQPGLNPLAAL